MRCEQVQDRLTDYLTGALVDASDIEVREHLTQCVACHAQATGLEQVWRDLGELAAMPADSDALRGRFVAMLEGYQQGHDAGQVTRLTPRRGWLPATWAQPLTQIAAGGVLLLTGVLIGQAGMRTPEAVPDVPALRAELHDVRQMLSLSLLQQQWATERLRGVTSIGQLEDPGSEVVNALLDVLQHDPNVNVRLAVVDVLVRLADRQAVRAGTVEALGTADSPLVQIALIDLLVDIEEQRSVDVLKRLATDSQVDETVRTRAAEGIKELGVQS